MKKSLLALAVLGAFAGTAAAQSSVTLFGIVDANLRYVKNGDNKMYKQDSNGLATSRLGFKGVEDLGGGLKAGFELQHGITPDTGAAGSAAKFWNRRSVVYLNGGFGEVRLGREYVATFWNINDFDPFGTTGIGSVQNIVNANTAITSSNATTAVRADNAVNYYLPSNLGGFYGQFTIAANEGAAGQTGNKYTGARLGYAAGPINVAFSYGQTDVATVAGFTSNKYKLTNLAASYDFGMAKLMAQYVDEKHDPAAQKSYLLGVVAPLGQGEIHASYVHQNDSMSGAGDNAKQFALGYVYNLSKRTALYGTYAHLSNGTNGRLVVSGGPTMSGPGQASNGLEAGIKHSF